MKYHIWTEGCQMNVANSQRVGSSLEHLGYIHTETIEEADVIVLIFASCASLPKIKPTGASPRLRR